jgi:hypothetical protein
MARLADASVISRRHFGQPHRYRAVDEHNPGDFERPAQCDPPGTADWRVCVGLFQFENNRSRHRISNA